MAYNILKHRRGTTQEWLETDVIPEDGELIIEECKDGSRKCKLGDGHTKFLMLPYMDDKVRIDLLKKIDSITANFNSELNATKSSLSERIVELDDTLSTAISRSADDLLNSISAQGDKLYSTITAEVSGDLSKLKSDLKTDIKQVNNRLDSEILETETELKAEFAETVDKLTSDFSKAIDELSEQTSTKFVQNNEEFNNILADERSERVSQVTLLKDDLKKVKTTLDDTKQVLTTKIDTAVNALDAKFSDRIDDNHSEVTVEIASLSDDLEATKVAINKTTTDLSSKITSITSSLAAAKQSFTNELVEETKNRTVQDSILTKKLEELGNKTQSSIDDLTIDLTKSSEALHAADALITENLLKETSERKSQVATLTKDAKELKNNIVGSIQPSINHIKEELEVSKLIHEQHSSDIEQVQTRLEEAITSFDNALEDHTNNFDTLLNDRLYNLSTDTASRVSAVEKAANDAVIELEKKHNNDLATAKETFTNKIEEANNTTQESIALLKSNLEKSDNALETAISKLEAHSNTIAANLLEQINNLSVKAELLDQADVTLLKDLAEANRTIASLSTSLSNDILDLRQRQHDDYVYINTELARLDAVQSSESTQILNMLFEHITQFYVELADLVDDDIVILKKLYVVNNDLKATIGELDSRLTSSISTVESQLTSNIESVNESLSSIFAEAKKTLEDSINSTKTKLTENIENIRSTTNIKISNNKKAIDDLELAILESNSATSDKFTTVNKKIDQLSSDIGRTADIFDGKISGVNSRIDSTNTRLDNQSKRLSNLIALTPGSTTGDAELIDIRNGYNGLYHASAGDAVRAIGDDLEKLKNSLPDYIPSNAVDGLLYEDNLLYLTSDGIPVSDPVEITGGTGGGSGSYSTVRVMNNLASNTFTVSKGNAIFINFTYTSFENEVPTGDGTYFITINNKRIDALSGTVQHDIAKELDVSAHLKNGTNTIKVTCTDQYGVSRSLVYNISVIELKITSAFDSTRIFDGDITFRYKVAGQVVKTVHILLDGKEIDTKQLAASVHNSETTLIIPRQAHGCHSLTAYMTATIDADDVISNTLKYEFICTELDKKEAMLASIYDQNTATQGDLLSIPFQVYDPSILTTNVDLIIYTHTAGVVEEYSRTTATTGRELTYWNTRQYPSGQVTFKISYTYSYYGEPRTIEKAHTLLIEALKVDVSPEEDGLQVYLSSQGRANTDAADVRDKWLFNSDNPNEPVVTTTFENFNWKTNGWITDNTGDVCLRLNGDARATINFAPFAKDFKEFGKTLEFEFLVRDVNSRDAIVIDCFDGTRGFRVMPDTAFLQSSGPKITCRFKDEERVRVSITVEHNDSGSRFISIYLDGILSGVQKYASDVIFSQVNALPIVLGSSLCGIDIYNIRVYDKALSTTQILKNYIADKAEPSIKQQLLTDNNILFTEDDAPDLSFVGQISYDKVKNLGQIPIITFTGSMPTFKGDKKKNSVYMTFEDPAHPELNFTKELLKEIDVQGTSSAGYVRKNWKIKLNNKIQHMPGAIPAKVFCIKVDYAEATGTHNTGTANYVETLYDRNQSIIPAQIDNPDIRTTIQGFPCIIFEKATEDSEPVFSSKGNFNYDKGAEDVFGFTEEFADFGVECWEFCNNISDCVSFLGPIPDDWKDDFEPRYTPIKSMDNPDDSIFDDIESLIEARANAEKGDGVFTAAQQELLSMLQADCIKNFKEMHDWVLSTATYKVISGNRVAIVPKNDMEAAELSDADKYLLPTPVVYSKTTYIYDTEEYRLAKFKNEFADHFDMHYSTMYYVFTLFALMVDQRAKNMFLTRWKNTDGKYRWYPYFYDNDTIFGINNVGALVFDYFHEDIDQLDSSDVYNGQNSTLWHNFRLCFANEIEALYRTLRSDNKITYEAIINQYVVNGSDKWSAAIYNADAEYKYISMARPDENGAFDANNLKQVRGPGEHHLRYFIANRLDYCDSKWYAGSYPSDQIVVRLYTPKTTEITDNMTEEQKATAEALNARILESQSVVPASSKITITPFSTMYAGIAYASGTRLQKRLNKGESYEFNAPEGVNTNDAETSIYGASMLSSLGDLSNLYCDYLDLSKANKLTHLKIGHESAKYHNDNIRSVKVGSNRLLKSIDIRNCSGLGVGDEKALDVTGCQNIETVYAEGTNLAAVSLPIGGYIKTLHLPASTNSIIIQDHQHIVDFSIESYDNVKTLRIENCPTLDTKAMLEACKKDGKYTVEYVFLSGFSWGTKENPVDVAFIKSLFPVFEDGKLVSGVLGLDEDGNTTTSPAFLDGYCYIDELTGADYAEIKSKFPHLKINFGKMTSRVIFKYKDITGNSYENVVSVEGLNSSLATCQVPNLTPVPEWPENDGFTYTLVGWSELEQESRGVEDSEDDYKAFPDAINGSSLKNIAGDRILYPVFKAIRKEYEIRFINPTSADSLLQVIMTPYNKDAEYTGPEPIKQDVTSPDLYEHIGWYPKPEKIKGPMTCIAQFAVKDDKWHVIGILDITDCEDYSGNIFDGYILNTSDNTMSITECNNYYNEAVKVPETITFDSGTFKVISLGGFSGHTTLKLLSLPETLIEILANGFYNCNSLFELTLPSNLKIIGSGAFQGCSKIKELLIPATVSSIGPAAFADCMSLNKIIVADGNTKYEVKQDCLVDKKEGILLKGLSSGIIPQDGSILSLGRRCFSYTEINSVKIPDGIDTVPDNAFSNCKSLVSVSLPSSLKTLSATCFAWCSNLNTISLPEGLIYINTYVFDSCALSDVIIPSTVESVLDHAFGDMPSLKTVTFKKRINPYGQVYVPHINAKAFAGSGTAENPIEFRLPWSADKTPDAPWGAVNARLIFDYEEEENNA